MGVSGNPGGQPQYREWNTFLHRSGSPAGFRISRQSLKSNPVKRDKLPELDVSQVGPRYHNGDVECRHNRTFELKKRESEMAREDSRENLNTLHRENSSFISALKVRAMRDADERRAQSRQASREEIAALREASLRRLDQLEPPIGIKTSEFLKAKASTVVRPFEVSRVPFVKKRIESPKGKGSLLPSRVRQTVSAELSGTLRGEKMRLLEAELSHALPSKIRWVPNVYSDRAPRTPRCPADWEKPMTPTMNAYKKYPYVVVDSYLPGRANPYTRPQLLRASSTSPSFASDVDWDMSPRFPSEFSKTI